MDKVRQYIIDNCNKVVRSNKNDYDTLIGLPYPYTVPCANDTFQELYYWDTYFTNVGLIFSGKTELAKNNIENMIYLIDKFGFMPNGNRTYYIYRSQPPFLSIMVKEVFEVTKDTAWLAHCYKALKKEYDFWQNDRMTESGLNRYFGQLKEYAENAQYLCSRVGFPLTQDKTELEQLGQSYYSGAESGWDFSSRFMPYSQNINPVCLNSLLWGMEKNMFYFADVIKSDEKCVWQERADKRLALMNDIMWNDEIGAFCDYDFLLGKIKSLKSTAMFYPMFVGLADTAQSERIKNILYDIEEEYGVACSENSDKILSLQWDYPNGWACQQYVVIYGLLNYGYKGDALRIARKYIDVVDRNFKTTNTLWEKYNVVTGKVSASSEYVTPPMMGWSAGVYLYCKNLIEA